MNDAHEVEVSGDGTFVYNAGPDGGSAVWTDAQGQQTRATYDARGDMLSLTDSLGNTTTWTYDARGDVITETSPNGATAYSTYNAAGQLVREVDMDGRVRVFSYDSRGDLTREDWLGSTGAITESINYVYDSSGRLIEASDAGSRYDYTYDSSGTLVRVVETGTNVGAAVEFDYQHNAQGQVTGVTISVNGVAQEAESYAYDGQGRVTQIEQYGVPGGAPVADKRVNFTYHDNQQYASITTYSDLAGTQVVATSTYIYSQNDRLSGIDSTQGNTTLDNLAWTYTSAGLVASYADSGGKSAYSYDASGQLIGVQNSNGTAQQYAYDAEGNRIGGGYQVGPANEILSDGTYDYTYDAEGNLTRQVDIATRTETDYTWDDRNRLASVTVKDAKGRVESETNYGYDPFNRLISETTTNLTGTTPQVTTTHYVDESLNLHPTAPAAGTTSQAPQDNLALVLNGKGQVTERYLYGPAVDQVLAEEWSGPGDQSVVAWMISDNQNTVRDVVMQAGGRSQVVDHLSYDAFGNLTTSTDPSLSLRVSYAGYQYDGATGLYYDRARFYDPRTGRFISQDPLSFQGGDSNVSRYADNSPVNATDPTGEIIPVLIIGGVALVTGLVAYYKLNQAADQYNAASEALGRPGFDPADLQEAQQLYGEAQNAHWWGNALTVAAFAIATLPAGGWGAELLGGAAGATTLTSIVAYSGWAAGFLSAELNLGFLGSPDQFGGWQIAGAIFSPLVGGLAPYASLGNLGGSLIGGTIDWQFGSGRFFGPGYQVGGLIGGLVGGSFNPSAGNWTNFSWRHAGVEPRRGGRLRRARLLPDGHPRRRTGLRQRRGAPHQPRARGLSVL